MSKPTREAVEKLKEDWLHDGVWDIEETEGFEAYREELYQFRVETETERSLAYMRHLEKYAERIGTDNLLIAQYIMNLENRIEELEEKVPFIG